MLTQQSAEVVPRPLTEDDLTIAATPGPSSPTRRIVLVAGSGRSGTSLMSGILRHMGMHVPEPEVLADHTNPRGFGEPQWVVDFHDMLLRRVNVEPGDARPGAWFEAGRAGTREWNRSDLTAWLQEQFEVSETLVVKDPRISWFLSMWRVAAVRCDATTLTVTMLRHPAEVVGSKKTYYGGRRDDIGRLAGWTNMMLFTERSTRHSPRSFVPYDELVADWTSSVVRVGEELDLDHIRHAGTRVMQEIHEFVDPDLHRVRASWDDLVVPAGLREIAEETWEQLNVLARSGGDDATAHGTLDELRRGYGELYAQAEAMAASSVHAAGPAYVRATRQARAAEAEAEARAAYDGASPLRKGYLRTRRLAGRVKRRLQAPRPPQSEA